MQPCRRGGCRCRCRRGSAAAARSGRPLAGSGGWHDRSHDTSHATDCLCQCVWRAGAAGVPRIHRRVPAAHGAGHAQRPSGPPPGAAGSPAATWHGVAALHCRRGRGHRRTLQRDCGWGILLRSGGLCHTRAVHPRHGALRHGAPPGCPRSLAGALRPPRRRRQPAGDVHSAPQDAQSPALPVSLVGVGSHCRRSTGRSPAQACSVARRQGRGCGGHGGAAPPPGAPAVPA